MWHPISSNNWKPNSMKLEVKTLISLQILSSNSIIIIQSPSMYFAQTLLWLSFPLKFSCVWPIHKIVLTSLICIFKKDHQGSSHLKMLFHDSIVYKNMTHKKSLRNKILDYVIMVENTTTVSANILNKVYISFAN